MNHDSYPDGFTLSGRQRNRNLFYRYPLRVITVRFILILLVAGLTGCSSSGFRFANRPPVWEIDDRRPIPIPEKTRYIRMDYYYRVLVRRPIKKSMESAPVRRSRDVNSYDHVPASSWYTPRLGYREMLPAELLNGIKRIGPPRPPVRVVRAKHLGSNPGFVIADSRDRLYLVKFDPPDFPAVETTTALIVNRLFWGFGYNVPEDYTFYFRSDEIPVDSTADITEEQVKLVLSSVAPPQNGVYRSTVSLLLDGIYLGPISDIGVRGDDPNDRFSHQDRRVLRGLKVFAAFVNQTDIRIDNSLDVYVGRPGHGYVKHYLLDFGEALGAHGTERGRIWDGFRHLFSFGEMFGNIFNLGLRSQPWEYIDYTPWKSVAAFEADLFQPAEWKEAYPFEPIRRALPDDNYWAAKIVAALTREHIAALVEAADYPEPGAADYVIETLMQRRQKIIDYYFRQVSPIEFLKISGDTLILEDLGLRYRRDRREERRYQVGFFNNGSHRISPPLLLSSPTGRLFIPVSEEMMRRGKGYVRVEVRVRRGDKKAPRAAGFHLRSGQENGLRLVGIVH